MFCNKCGKQLNNDDKFCPACGNKVKTIQPQDKIYKKVFTAEEKGALSFNKGIHTKEVNDWFKENDIEIVDVYGKIYLNLKLMTPAVELQSFTIKYKKKKVDYHYGIFSVIERKGVFTSAGDKCDKTQASFLKDWNAQFVKQIEREAYLPGGSRYQGRIVVYKKNK